MSSDSYISNISGGRNISSDSCDSSICSDRNISNISIDSNITSISIDRNISGDSKHTKDPENGLTRMVKFNKSFPAWHFLNDASHISHSER